MLLKKTTSLLINSPASIGAQKEKDMGDYANDEIERSLHEYLDELEDGDIDDDSFIYNGVVYTTFEFKSIKKETGKAWCLIMMGGAERWFPKSKCSINENMIAIPNWLKNKIIMEH